VSLKIGERATPLIADALVDSSSAGVAAVGLADFDALPAPAARETGGADMPPPTTPRATRVPAYVD
jgi:hypothetical protein